MESKLLVLVSGWEDRTSAQMQELARVYMQKNRSLNSTFNIHLLVRKALLFPYCSREVNTNNHCSRVSTGEKTFRVVKGVMLAYRRPGLKYGLQNFLTQ